MVFFMQDHLSSFGFRPCSVHVGISLSREEFGFFEKLVKTIRVSAAVGWCFLNRFLILFRKSEYGLSFCGIEAFRTRESGECFHSVSQDPLQMRMGDS